jgi:hypothetical protein
MGIARFANPVLMPGEATRGLTGNESQETHELARMRELADIPTFRHKRGGGEPVNAPEGLSGPD